MRIGIFVIKAGTDAGGLETYERNLVRSLAKIDKTNEYHLFCASRAALDNLDLAQENFHGHVLWPASRWLSVPVSLPLSMIRSDVNVLHATFVPPPFSPRPFVFTVHDAAPLIFPAMWPRRIRLRMAPLIRRGLKKASFLVCDSEATRNYVSDAFNIPDEAMSVVYCGCDEVYQPLDRDAARRILRDAYGIEDPFLLFVGRLEPRKNPVRLLRAFDLFRRETGTPLKFVLAGKKTWSAKEVDDEIRKLDLREHVIELGYVPMEHLPQLYNAAEMLVFATLWEGFGLPAIEAMACGTPVLTSTTSCMPEVTDGAALLVDPHSTEEIAAGMHKLCTDAPLREKLRARGLRRAKCFTWERTARQTLDAYRKAAAR